MQWTLGEDVRIGAIFDDVMVAKQDLQEAAHGNKPETRFFRLLPHRYGMAECLVSVALCNSGRA